MKISMIVAYSTNRVIGSNNKLPWYLPADLAHFKKITMEKPILMGRKTHESIGKPLPGRRNIVISSSKQYPGCDVFSSVDAALKALEHEEEIMVIGGASIYTQLLSRADQLYITEIDAHIPGDALFPEINLDEWQLISSEKHLPDEKNSYCYIFQHWKRAKNF